MAEQMLNLAGGLPPEILQQQQQLNRQQQMAQLLMQQGMNQPQGQMVSGQYVKPSIFQQLVPLAQLYAGQSLAEKGDKQALNLAKQLREQQQKMGEEYFGAMQGKPAVYGADIPTETYETVKGSMISPATGPDYRKAFSIATDPYAPSWLKSQAAEMLKPQKVGEGEKVFRFNPVTGKNEVVAEGGEKFRAPLQVDTGSRIEYRDPRDPTKVLSVVPKSVGPAEAARLNYEGIPFGGGGGGTVMPAGGSMPTGNVLIQPQATQQNVPQYQYNPQLTLKQNQEAAAEFSKKMTTTVTNAKDTFDLLKSAASVLSTNAPSSGRIENIVTGTREMFGGGGEASKADADLKMIGDILASKQPRFEGPQSNIDVQFYQKMAGDLGNPNLPINTRLNTIKRMIELNKKYNPDADWDSIDVAGPVKQKNILGGTRGLGAKISTPTEFKKTLSGDDKAAFEWATKNPNDPRAAQIRNRLGIE